ncbi:MAG: hypothetical protein OSB29_11620, partial [Verrucomicrobiota bacterium]|nr:hypothetical protein [Verrucomicrobiota bacterium]
MLDAAGLECLMGVEVGMRGLIFIGLLLNGLARAQDAAETAPALAASASLSGYVSTGYRWGPGTGNFA